MPEKTERGFITMNRRNFIVSAIASAIASALPSNAFGYPSKFYNSGAIPIVNGLTGKLVIRGPQSFVISNPSNMPITVHGDAGPVIIPPGETRMFGGEYIKTEWRKHDYTT